MPQELKLELEARVFAVLEGCWALSREIPGHGSMRGSARFERVHPALLRYREEGQLRLDSGARPPAGRQYHYLLEPGLLRIAFADGGSRTKGTLHRLRLRRCGDEEAGGWPLCAEDVHHCGQDTYLGRYRFESASRISIQMVVRGPAKDYAIHTTLERA